MNSISKVIDHIKSDPNFMGLPEEARQHVIAGLEDLQFQVITQFDECSTYIKEVFKKNGFDLDNIPEGEEGMEECVAAVGNLVGEFINDLVPVLTQAHIAEKTNTMPDAFQKALMDVSVFCHVLCDTTGGEFSETPTVNVHVIPTEPGE